MKTLAEAGTRVAGGAAMGAGDDAKRLGDGARSGRPGPARTARASAAAAKARNLENVEKTIDVAEDPLNRPVGQLKDELTRR